MLETLGKSVEVEISGEKYTLRPITVRTLVEMEKHIRSIRLASVMGEDRFEVLRMPITDEDRHEFLTTVEGMCWLVWACVGFPPTYDTFMEKLSPQTMTELNTYVKAIGDSPKN